MQILTLVLTVLMLLSIITYTKLKTFLDFSAFRAEYVHYIVHDKNTPYNDYQLDLYKSHHGEENDPEKEEKEKSDDQPKKDRLSSSISMDFFLKKEQRDSLKFKSHHQLMKRLMESLYQHQTFYQEIKEKRPDFVDQILQRIMDASETETYKGKLKHKKDLATINLEDPELQDVYYKMLHGTREKQYAEQEFMKKEGYLSLLNFVKVGSGSQKNVSIYLAPGEVLMALYGDESLVKEIIQAREVLYKEVKSGLSTEQAGLRLKEVFQGRSFLGADEEGLIDYGVSKSDPKLYR